MAGREQHTDSLNGVEIAQAGPPKTPDRQEPQKQGKSQREGIRSSIESQFEDRLPGVEPTERLERLTMAVRVVTYALKELREDPAVSARLTEHGITLKNTAYYIPIIIKASALKPEAEGGGYFQIYVDQKTGKSQTLSEVEKYFGRKFSGSEIHYSGKDITKIYEAAKKNTMAGILYWHLCRDVYWKKKELPIQDRDRDRVAAVCYTLGPTAFIDLWNTFQPKDFTQFARLIGKELARKFPENIAIPEERRPDAYHDDTYNIGYWVHAYETGVLSDTQVIKIGKYEYKAKKLLTTLRYAELIDAMMGNAPATTKKLPEYTSTPETLPPHAQFRTDRLYDYTQKDEYGKLVKHGQEVDQLFYGGREEMIRLGVLVPVKADSAEYFAFRSDESPGEDERYLRPYALKELREIAKKFYDRTVGYKLVITSIFRSPDEQREIAGHNEAATTGVSTHTMANSFDIPDGRFMTPDGKMITWSENPEMRTKIEGELRPLISEILLGRQQKGGSMTFHEKISWHVMAANPETGDGSRLEKINPAEAQGKLDSIEIEFLAIKRDLDELAQDQFEWIYLAQMGELSLKLEAAKVPPSNAELIRRRSGIQGKMVELTSRTEARYEELMRECQAELLDEVEAAVQEQTDIHVDMDKIPQVVDWKRKVARLSAEDENSLILQFESIIDDHLEQLMGGGSGEQVPVRTSELDSLSANDLFRMIDQNPAYTDVPKYKMMRFDRYMEDPVIRAYMETATYHDFLRHGFILRTDETERYGYLDPQRMWARKIRLSRGNNRTSMQRTWENIQDTEDEDLTLGTYRQTVEEVWNDMLPRLRAAGLVNRYTESITPDTIFAISIHELAPTHMREAEGYNALARVHTMRTLLDEGFQPQKTPAIHDTAASYGVGQTIRSTHNALRDEYNTYMPDNGKIPVFERNTTLRGQLEVVIWFAFQNLGAVDHNFSGDFFTRLYENSTENQRMRFFASVIAAMHNAGNSRGTREAMRKTFHGSPTGRHPDRADFWVDNNEDTRDVCENLEDARIAYLNIIRVNRTETAMRHGTQVVEIYEVLNEREGRTTPIVIDERTPRPKGTRVDVVDTNRKLTKRTHKGREYFVFSIPSWNLGRLGTALLTGYNDTTRKDIGDFNNLQMGAEGNDYVFKPKDVIWIPIDLMKTELKSGEFITVRVKDVREARTKISQLCKNTGTATEDIIMLYSNDKSYGTFDEVKGKIRIPKSLLKKGWETIK